VVVGQPASSWGLCVCVTCYCGVHSGRGGTVHGALPTGLPTCLPTPTFLLQAPVVTNESSPQAVALAKRLKAAGARMYGAFWCSHCFEQKQVSETASQRASGAGRCANRGVAGAALSGTLDVRLLGGSQAGVHGAHIRHGRCIASEGSQVWLCSLFGCTTQWHDGGDVWRRAAFPVPLVHAAGVWEGGDVRVPVCGVLPRWVEEGGCSNGGWEAQSCLAAKQIRRILQTAPWQLCLQWQVRNINVLAACKQLQRPY
jgi:hypothetical protein